MISRIKAAKGSDPLGQFQQGPYLRFPDALFGEVGVSCPPTASVYVDWKRGALPDVVYKAAASWGTAISDAPVDHVERIIRGACLASLARSLSDRTVIRSDLGFDVSCRSDAQGKSWHIEVTQRENLY